MSEQILPYLCAYLVKRETGDGMTRRPNEMNQEPTTALTISHLQLQASVHRERVLLLQRAVGALGLLRFFLFFTLVFAVFAAVGLSSHVSLLLGQSWQSQLPCYVARARARPQARQTAEDPSLPVAMAVGRVRLPVHDQQHQQPGQGQEGSGEFQESAAAAARPLPAVLVVVTIERARAPGRGPGSHAEGRNAAVMNGTAVGVGCSLLGVAEWGSEKRRNFG